MISPSERLMEEERYLQHAKNENPALFLKQTYIDDANALQAIGIELPNKDTFPKGLIKLRPEDFIVEEIAADGQVCTIDMESKEPRSAKAESTSIRATLVKCGLSTIEAVDALAAELQCSPESIQYTGVKDTDAITSQRIMFQGIPLEKIKQVSSSRFFLKDIVPMKGFIRKGFLKGNQFSIVVRTEPAFSEQEHFAMFIKNIKRIKEEGFYNFYYFQRFGLEFGTSRTNSLAWAIPIFQGKYEEAVVAFLSAPAERELEYFKRLRNTIKAHSGDWQYIENLIAPLAHTFESELKLVRYLKDHPTDFIGALQQIPDQVTLLIYSVSSYLFNKKISAAIKHNKLLPAELPLFLSDDPEDRLLYKAECADLNIPLDYVEYLKALPFIELKKRMVPVKQTVTFTGADLTDQGIMLCFSLGKGSYATTLLAHLFNLVSGKPLGTLSQETLELYSDPTIPRNKTIHLFRIE
jgi:TruD family tRNA pseudouridine synthase